VAETRKREAKEAEKANSDAMNGAKLAAVAGMTSATENTSATAATASATQLPATSYSRADNTVAGSSVYVDHGYTVFTVTSSAMPPCWRA